LSGVFGNCSRGSKNLPLEFDRFFVSFSFRLYCQQKGEVRPLKRLQVKVKRLSKSAKLPSYAHPEAEGEMGSDLYALTDEILEPDQIKLIRTGIALELPPQYGAMVEDRSGLAVKGICTLAGLIDSGYRGEIKVIVVNLGSEVYKIQAGDRIAQLRLSLCHPTEFVEVDELGSSIRGEGGFGSTGR
jgi:dUTP pyrophosphatase